MTFYRLQLIPDEDLGSLYDLLIDDPPEIRRAIGALVYDHLIDQSSRTGLFALETALVSFVLLSHANDFYTFRKC